MKRQSSIHYQATRRKFSIGDLAVTPHGVLDRVIGIWWQEMPFGWHYMLRGRQIWWSQAHLAKPDEWQSETLKVYPVDLPANCPTCGRVEL